jgi:uncharacterized ferredoxin-like protein
MKKDNVTFENKALEAVANQMVLAARTAPKTKGVDNIIIKVLKGKNLLLLAKKMEKISKEQNRPGFYRDAQNIKKSHILVLIAAKSSPAGLKYCGFCGYKNCEDMLKNKGACAYNAIDLGIAAGSAVGVASIFHADNRIMYSAGKAAMELGFIKNKLVKQALGIPLSATGKNIFFDRK